MPVAKPRNGEVLRAQQGGSVWKWPSDTVARIDTSVHRLQFTADQITRERVGVQVTGLAVFRIVAPLVAWGTGDAGRDTQGTGAAGAARHGAREGRGERRDGANGAAQRLDGARWRGQGGSGPMTRAGRPAVSAGLWQRPDVPLKLIARGAESSQHFLARQGRV